jgi:hypothetical protein
MSDTQAKTENTSQQRIDIPISIDRTEIVQWFKSERTRPVMEKHLEELIPMVQNALHAKALYRVACVTARGDDWLEIENVRFSSQVLSKSLADVDTVFVSLVTCGKELDELPVSPKEYMRYLCLETIKTYVIYKAGEYLINHIKEKFSLPDITHLHPGEFADLGIEQQVPLYSLFTDSEKAIGVKLTATKTLQPLKSASSIMFYNGPSFQSCELCLQPKCQGRRAPYNPKLAEKFGIKTKKINE